MIQTLHGKVRGKTIELTEDPGLAEGQEVEISLRTTVAGAAGAEEITIVDRGRGPQLSSCRITVQDLVPYFQRNCSHAQIIEIMPTLTTKEIEVVEEYVSAHREEVTEQDRRIRDRNAKRQTSPKLDEISRRGAEKMAAVRAQKAPRNQGPSS